MQIEPDVLAAVNADDVARLRTLAEARGSATVRGDGDPRYLTALHIAAAAGALNAIRFLASDAVGADVNAARRNNFTPLHAAAMRGAAEVCAVLLELGAQPDAQTRPQGYAPLHSAAWGGHTDAVDVLVRAGARTDLRNYRGETPAQTARRQGKSATAERLEAATGGR